MRHLPQRFERGRVRMDAVMGEFSEYKVVPEKRLVTPHYAFAAGNLPISLTF